MQSSAWKKKTVPRSSYGLASIEFSGYFTCELSGSAFCLWRRDLRVMIWKRSIKLLSVELYRGSNVKQG